MIYFIAEQISVLKGHSGLVKGVTWDPVGKYLASQVNVTYSQQLQLIYFFLVIALPYFVNHYDFHFL